MTPLRKKMFEVLRAKNLPLETQERYVAEIAAMAASYKRSPDQLNPEQVRDYLERCAREMIADKLLAFGHFYEGTLGWGWDAEMDITRITDHPKRGKPITEYTASRSLKTREADQ